MVTTYNGKTVKSWRDFSPNKAKCFSSWSGNQTVASYISLDTETSHNHEEDENKLLGWIYQWAFTYEDTLVYGRRPSELMECFKKIVNVNGLGRYKVWGKEDEYVTKKIVVFVHNLSYDYEYMKAWLRQSFPDGEEKTIAVAAHKVIVYETHGIQFRCSYRLTQKSLDAWAKAMNSKNRKLVGAIDYDKVRYQDDELTQTDWDYMFMDVLTLDECVSLQMKVHNDDITTIPYTVTGYVRRDARKAFKNDSHERVEFRRSRLYYETYMLCRKEFAGALTHGNRFKQGQIVKGCIRHRDFSSHYPSQQRYYYAPVGAPTLEFDASTDGDMSMHELLEIGKNHCFLAAITIENPEVKEGITLPYLQTYKFFENKTTDVKTIDDNGRILKATGRACIVVNEIDLKWLVKQYKFSFHIEKVYKFQRGKFPKYLRDTVDNYFVGKTVLKNKCKALKKQGFSEDSIEYIEAYRDLMIVKGKLNGIYGMSATDPVRQMFIDSQITGEWEHPKLTEEEIKIALEEYYDGKNNFMAYQLGVWTTALARNELLEFVELIGYENFIYADTDSIFYFSTPEIEERIEARNAYFRDQCDKTHCFIEVEDKRIYYNQFELEDEVITEFKFLHSKCYAYIVLKEDGTEEMIVVIAGVAKHGRNGNTRVNELGSLDELKDGKVFVDCGGTQTKYSKHWVAETMVINGHVTEVGGAAVIFNSKKTLKGIIARDETDIYWEAED